MKKYKTQYYEVIDNQGKLDKVVIKKCSNSYKKNKKFFGKNSKFFIIRIVHTEDDFRKGAKQFYNPWVKGVGLKGNIVVIRGLSLFQKNYEKHGGTASFERLLTHEINHIFASQSNLYRGPFWITEGLAMYVAGQTPGDAYKTNAKITKERARNLLFYRKILKNLCPEMYVVHYQGIAYLVKRFGKEKLTKLIKSYHVKTVRKDFEKNFRQIYGVTYDTFLKDFLNQYDHEY